MKQMKRFLSVLLTLALLITLLPIGSNGQTVKAADNPIFKENAGWDLTKQNEGVISLPNGGSGGWLEFYDKYTEMDLTLRVKDDPNVTSFGRTSVVYEFENGQTLDLSVVNEANRAIIQMRPCTVNDAASGWKALYVMSTEERAKFTTTEGIQWRLAWSGTQVKLYLDGEPRHTVDLASFINAGTEATVKLRHDDDAGIKIDIPFTVSDTVVKPIFKDNANWILAKQNEGLISLPNGGAAGWLYFYDVYKEMDLTLRVKDDPNVTSYGRTSVVYEFGNDQTLDLSVVNEASRAIIQMRPCTVNNNGWKTLYVMSGSERAKFTTMEGIQWRLAWSGTQVKLYLDGELRHTVDLISFISEGIEATVKLRHDDDAGIKIDIPFTVSNTVTVKPIFKDNAGWDLTKQNDGVISLPNGGNGGWLEFYDKYTEMDLTLTVKDDPGAAAGRVSLRYEFDNGQTLELSTVVDNGSGIIQMKPCTVSASKWKTLYKMNEAEHAKFTTTDGIQLRLEWKGTQVKMYLDGELRHTVDLAEFITAGTEASVKLRHDDDAGILIDIPFLMSYASLAKGTLKGITVSLGDNIGVNFFVELSERTIADQAAYVQFALPGVNYTEEKVMIKDALQKTYNGKSCYVFSCGIAAKEMASNIKLKIVSGDGTEGTEYTYTVKEYGDTILGDEKGTYTADDKAMVKAMLNYGAYAQMYFKNNTGNLANAGMDDADKVLGEGVVIEETYNCTISGSCTGLTYYGTSLMTTSKTAIRHYFELSDGANIAAFTFKYGDTELDSEEKGGRYYVEIPEILASKLGDMYDLTVTIDNERMTLTYGPYTNVKAILAGDAFSEDSKNMMKALYWYGQEAAEYLKKN